MMKTDSHAEHTVLAKHVSRHAQPEQNRVAGIRDTQHRFLILGRDDVPEQNLVWKDTVLVRTGETVDILLADLVTGRAETGETS